MIDVDNIMFRASSIGKIMTNDRSGKKMGETCKKYLIEVYINEVYGRKKELTNKYITKGLAVEEDSLTLYSRVKKEFYKKNELKFHNYFICGTPDIIIDDRVIDIKSSYDIFTFFASKGGLNAAYYWQLQAYMALTNRTKATLAYCLVNTPEPLINDEKRRLMWKMGVIDETEETIKACAEIDKMVIYDDIPISERVHEIVIERDDKAIESIYNRVGECRGYIENYFHIEMQVQYAK